MNPACWYSTDPSYPIPTFCGTNFNSFLLAWSYKSAVFLPNVLCLSQVLHWFAKLLRLASGSHVRVRAWKASWNLEEKREPRRVEKQWNQDTLVCSRFKFLMADTLYKMGKVHSRQFILGAWNQLQVVTCRIGSSLRNSSGASQQVAVS